MRPEPAAFRPRRQDIQGLRALGALLVAAFHIWERGISGGVDIFFVISGYFLATSFLQRAAAGVTVDAPAQWGMFLRRTVPEVLVILTGVLALGLLVTSPVLWSDLLRSVVFSALYLENYWLIWSSQDYLARTASLSMVQHFWAVALIGQVYFVWPVLGKLAERIAAWRRRPVVPVMGAILAGLVVLSFGWSVVWTAIHPTAAYFDLTTRFWQFGTGALLGLSPSLAARISGRVAIVLSWLGLALVLSCGLLIGATAQFPGFASLWPVTAAALILLAGNPDQPGNAGRLLALPPLAGLGAFAFGIYLWHWPLYVVLLDARQGAMPTLLMGVALVAVSVLLAWVSAHFASRVSAASKRLGGPWLLPVASVAGLVAVAAMATVLERTLSWSRAGAEEVVATLGHHVLEPGALTARSDKPEAQKMGCLLAETAPTVERCVFGSADPTRTVFLVGGSHSLQWLPALRVIAEAERWRIVLMTKVRCPFANPWDTAFFESEGLNESCVAWNADVMGEILAARPDIVFTIATRKIARPHTDELGEHVPSAYLVNFAVLNDAGIPVVAIRDTPWLTEDVPACVYSVWNGHPDDCGIARDKVLDDAHVAIQAGQLPAQVAWVDMTDTVCDAEHCGVVRDGKLIYRDSDHLTASYARSLAPLLGDRITASLIRMQQATGWP